MKGSDQTVQALAQYNKITELQNQNAELAAELKTIAGELIGVRKIVRAYELAKMHILNQNPHLLPMWDTALSQALAEVRSEIKGEVEEH